MKNERTIVKVANQAMRELCSDWAADRAGLLPDGLWYVRLNLPEGNRYTRVAWPEQMSEFDALSVFKAVFDWKLNRD